MNTGAFGEGFPYSNFHDLNMDWIIKIAKDFLDQYTHIENTIDTGLSALDTKAEELQALLNAWYEEHSEDIANQLADALEDLNNWYTEHQNDLSNELLAKISEFNTSADQKARQTIDSIPSDYSTLSNEVSALENRTNSAEDAIAGIEILHSILNPVFTQGRNISSQGVFVGNASRIATKDFIDITSARTQATIPLNDNEYTSGIYYSVNTGYRFYVAYYSSDSESDFVSSEGWLTGTGKLTPTGNYMRLGYATVDDVSVMNVSDANNITLTKSYPLDTIINKINKWGLLHRGNAGNVATDLNDIITTGMYILPSTPITNQPTSERGTLIVIPSITTISTSPSLRTDLMQIIIVASGTIYMRYARYTSGNYSFRNWIIVNTLPIVEKTKWLAVGDSITYGVYSYDNGDNPASGVTQNSWVHLLANALNYDVSVMASRGMGYTVTGQDPLDSSQPRINLDTLLTRIEAMTDTFNLVTMWFGINDYATSYSTISALETSLNDAIERLSIKFPHARLVVITPLNSWRSGDASSNYSYNTAIGSKTLKQVADAIKSRCEAYGVECIYATNGFLLNTFNIENLLPDQTHPSEVCHKLIAKNLAHLLLN